MPFAEWVGVPLDVLASASVTDDEPKVQSEYFLVETRVWDIDRPHLSLSACWAFERFPVLIVLPIHSP